MITDTMIRDAIISMYDETPCTVDNEAIRQAKSRIKRRYTSTTPTQSHKKWTHNPLTGQERIE